MIIIGNNGCNDEVGKDNYNSPGSSVNGITVQCSL